jgi:thiol-disulfide isomerase/thioredoxin
VIVHFFATWREPCRAEMAALRRVADRFAQKPITILAISVTEVDVRVRRFFETEPVSFPILLDRDRAVSATWQVSTLPTTFALDRSLKPRLVVEGDFDWDRVDSDERLSALATEPINRTAHRGASIKREDPKCLFTDATF